MAMNKKERAAVDAAILKSEILGALRWTSPVERDVRPPKGVSTYVEGWDFNVYSLDVWLGWSSASSHGRGLSPENGYYSGGSQKPRALYSTKTLALKALRHEYEMLVAKNLQGIDRQIADEVGK